MFLKEVIIEEALLDHPRVIPLLNILKSLNCQVVDTLNEVQKKAVTYEGDALRYGKRVLVIREYRGKLVKDCPGTKGHICCGYKVINAMTNCPMDCSYCILQTYLDNPFITWVPDTGRIFSEINQIIRECPQRIFRFGTGELADSLVLDPWISFAAEGVAFFSDAENGILELKTKSAEVTHLLGLDHRGHTVVSWSLNPARIIGSEELHTAPLHERLKAAKQCQEAGYPIGFHFDPLIAYPGWEDDYRDTVDQLFRYIDPRGIIWISLGALRYPPLLKRRALDRFPDTPIFTGEFIPAEDGKFRYFKQIRIDMYHKMYTWLRGYDRNLFIYLCMERDDVWRQAFGWSPGHTFNLNRLFEDRIDRHVRS
jgi:spore photoproduct lyase